MNPESEPHPIPNLVTSSPVLPLTEIGKKAGGEWTLTLLPSHLALADAPGAQPYVILREHIMKTAILMESTRAFVVEQPRRVMFKLTPAGAATLAEWIGKPFLAGFYLKRRYSWVSLWAVLWVGGALITLVAPAQDGTRVPFDVVGFLLGLTLLGASAVARWRPHPVLFLVDSIWFFSVSLRLLGDILHGRSKGWLVLVALLVWTGVTGFRHFMRFRNIKVPRFVK
ncbi:MAG: hypothetical protein QM813_17780 [Verrucomicrobiota bacterium]